jgi:hypothetical protein
MDESTNRRGVDEMSVDGKIVDEMSRCQPNLNPNEKGYVR